MELLFWRERCSICGGDYIFERFDKRVIEAFAQKVIAKSFDSCYGEYYTPEDTNNFDFISPDQMAALEVTLVISENEKNVYEYGKELAKGKKDLKKERIKWGDFSENDQPVSYYGGSLAELYAKIRESLKKKNEKAKHRLNQSYRKIDLCICVNDGGMMDLSSFELAELDFSTYIFENIFFITRECFIRYNRSFGYQEYERIF